MSIRQTIENDFRDYIIKSENMRTEDKIRHLMALTDKHLEYQKLTHVIQKHEFSNIVSHAATNMTNMPTNLHITGSKVDQYQQKHVAMIEAVINYMNRHELLKKQVEFNYTQEPNFESNEDLS